MQVVGLNGVPDGDLVEAVSYSSTNPFFKTEEFRWMLIRYRKEGCHAEHPKPPPAPRTIVKALNRRRNIAKGQSENWCE